MQTGADIPHDRPLAGLRILEMAALGPLPLAGTLLAGFGADVVRIQKEPDDDVAVRSRRVVRLNLKSPEGRAACLDLVSGANALLEGFRPGTMERLGLGPADCHARAPALVYCRMTGWGQDGPLAREAGHDINYIALSGVLGRITRPNERPAVPLNLIGDYGGGTMTMLFGLMTALWRARATGQGEVIDAAMIDGAAIMMSKQFALHGQDQLGPPGTNLLDGGAFFYDTYVCADGRHVAVGAIEPKFYKALLAVLDLTEGDLPQQSDQARWPEGRRIFAETFLTRTRDDWVARARDKDACLTPVLDLDEAVAHPHARARSSFSRAEGGAWIPALAPRLASMDGRSLREDRNSEIPVAEIIADWRARSADATEKKGTK